MYKALIEDSSFQIELDKDGKSGRLNDTPFSIDLIESGAGTFHLIRNHKSYLIQIENNFNDEKKVDLRINGKIVQVQLKSKLDSLLESMGLSQGGAKKINETKAPMPGLVLKVLAHEGQEVQKGDPLLVLEAMKMENIIKAPGNATVGKIMVNQGQAVEKNQVLLRFQ